MDKHIRDYYSVDPDSGGSTHFHRVIALHDAPDLEWERLLQICPDLTRGWFEVAQLPKGDRLDFLHAYWLRQLPFQLHLREGVAAFFSRLDDIGIYLVQKEYDSSFCADMVYSVAADGGFYRGAAPGTDEAIDKLKGEFSRRILPNDYLAFLQIHNGFSKSMDTGVLSHEKVLSCYQRLQELIVGQVKPLTDHTGQLVNPETLIPFYASFDLPCYQCFWGEWYPQDEMGNVYYSGIEGTISSCSNPDTWGDNLAFPTFLDWFLFYIEDIEG